MSLRARTASLASACCLVVLAGGCSSSPKTISRQDFHTDAQQAASLASESVLFANLKAAGKTTDAYAAEHPKYLEHQAEQLLKEANQARASADQAPAFERYHSGLGELSKSIQLLHASDSAQLQSPRTQLQQELETFKAIEEETK